MASSTEKKDACNQTLLLTIVCVVSLLLILVEGVGLVLVWRYNQLEIDEMKADIQLFEMRLQKLEENGMYLYSTIQANQINVYNQ